jgi:hypothetical protein
MDLQSKHGMQQPSPSREIAFCKLMKEGIVGLCTLCRGSTSRLLLENCVVN